MQLSARAARLPVHQAMRAKQYQFRQLLQRVLGCAEGHLHPLQYPRAAQQGCAELASERSLHQRFDSSPIPSVPHVRRRDLMRDQRSGSENDRLRELDD